MSSRSAIERVPHCSHWGAFNVLVDSGRIVGVEPFADDPAPSDIIRSVPHWADPSWRVPQPMVREGWLRDRGRADGAARGRERFVPMDWEVALDLAAEEIVKARDEHGPQSLFAGSYGWTSAGRVNHAATLLKRMLGLAGGYTGHINTYSIAAGPVILRRVLGSDEACNGRATTLDVIAEHSNMVLVFGALSPRTSQIESGGLARHTLEGHLRRLQERGARIVHVSPCRDDLPEWLDAEWLPIRPNADVALMLALTQELIAQGLADRHFLARHCSGSERLLDYLDGGQDGVEKNADWAAAITSLEASRIRKLAADLVRSRSMITVSWSLQRADHGEQPYWAAVALAAAVGQIGLPGGGVGFGYGSLGAVGGPIVDGRTPAMSAGINPTASFIPVARIADLLSSPGKAYLYDGQTRTYPDISLVYWAGGNPFHHHQDLNRLRQAWSRPRTIIVQDPQWTATARHADIVLPASTSLERNDIAGHRRSDYIMAMKQAIAPVGQARSDYAIFRDLSGRLGVDAAFTEGRDEMGWIRHLYEATREDACTRFQYELPEFDSFWERGFARLPARTGVVYMDAFRRDPEANPLTTESGRIVLYSDRIAEMGYDDCPPHPAWLEPAEWLGSRTPQDHYLHLVSRQPRDKLHSQLDFSALSQAAKRQGRAVVSIHPTDAGMRGITDGGAVRLWNSRGQCLASAHCTETVRPGVVVLPTGAWYSPDQDSGNSLELAGNPNVLTRDVGTSSLAQGCAAHTCLVSIEPWSAPRHEAHVPEAAPGVRTPVQKSTTEAAG